VLADDLLALLDGLRGREFEAIVDAYAQSGAVKASITYYRARAAGRQAQTAAPRRNPRSASPR